MKLVDITLNEGGTAFADQGTKRIKREDIPATIKHVSELIGISKGDLISLGTTGKLADSGDIDLAIDANKYSQEHVDSILKSHGITGKVNKSNRVSSYPVPIKGDKEKGLVQVDLMFTPNPSWAEFSYFSPGEGSRYKGIVRTVLIAATASVINEPGTDHFEYLPQGDLVARVGRTLDLPHGLKRVFQYREKKMKGDGYNKNMKSISVEDFKKMYPEVQIKNGQMVIDDPEKVVKALFGKDVTPTDVQSAEQVLHLIKKKFNNEDQKKIFRIAANRLIDQRGKIRIPEEIEQRF